jgi:glutamate synthase (NADPH) large chain
VNMEMVALDSLNLEDQEILREFLDKHFQYTTSNIAFQLIQNWEESVKQFVKVMPGDFKKALEGRGVTLAQQIADKNIVYQDIVVDVEHP